MHGMLDISVSLNQEATQVIVEMEPGTVFAHDGDIFLKLRGPNAMFLDNASGHLREIGKFPESESFVIKTFMAEAYGRVARKAELKIEL